MSGVQQTTARIRTKAAPPISSRPARTSPTSPESPRLRPRRAAAKTATTTTRYDTVDDRRDRRRAAPAWRRIASASRCSVLRRRQGPQLTEMHRGDGPCGALSRARRFVRGVGQGPRRYGTPTGPSDQPVEAGVSAFEHDERDLRPPVRDGTSAKAGTARPGRHHRRAR